MKTQSIGSRSAAWPVTLGVALGLLLGAVQGIVQAQTTTTTVLVPKGAIWQWHPAPVAADWMKPDFAADDWATGPAKLGFGHSDDATAIVPPEPGFGACYFRHAFEFGGEIKPVTLLLRLLREDGAIVYLNRQEVLRTGMPLGPVTGQTPALQPGGISPDFYYPFKLPGELLATGRNVLAVEVHQAILDRYSLAFDLELSAIFNTATDLPQVSIKATVPQTVEPSPMTRIRPGVFTLSRSGGVAEVLRIYLKYGGTAKAGSDYEALPAAVDFQPGQVAMELAVQPLDDRELEPTETVEATLLPPQPDAAGTARESYMLAPDATSAVVSILDNGLAGSARLLITTPADGTTAVVGSEVLITAKAMDPKGYISRVEFYDGEELIRVSEMVFIRAPYPGETITHHTKWTPKTVGDHFLTCRAVDTAGAAVVSAPVVVKVVPEDTRPVVSIRATTPDTTEPSPLSRIIPGVFTLERQGPLTEPLTVAVKYAGTAKPGSDYTALPEVVAFAPGAATVELTVTAMDDQELEPTETVEATLVQPTEDPSGGVALGYRVDPDRATDVVSIHDNGLAGKAYLTITSPKAGAYLAVGKETVITAEAVDPKGYVSRVEFLDGNEVIGVSEPEFFRAPYPGEVVTHQVAWTPKTEGEHVLNCRAALATGEALVSAPVVIKAVTGDTRPVVSVEAVIPEARELPPYFSSVRAGAFQLTRTGDLSEALTVFFSISGTATPGKDYATITPPVEFPPRAETVTLYVTPFPDEETEQPESVILTLDPEPTVGPGPLPDRYVISSDQNTAHVVIYDWEHPAEAKLIMTTPPDGSVLPTGVPIVLAATAVDPAGEIREVEFYADGQLLGVSRILTKEMTVPGRPRYHSWIWQDAPEGSHVLQARAKTSQGVALESPAVHIEVKPLAGEVVVELTTLDGVATEPPSATGELDTAAFGVLRVGGPLEVDVRVPYLIEGTAENGIDYQKLTGEVILPAGEKEAKILIEPLADDVRESEETVVLRLAPPEADAAGVVLNRGFRLGERFTAEAVIRDAQPTGNLAPKAWLASPADGAVFELGSVIELRAEAADPDGRVTKLRILEGETVLGEADSGELKIAWTDAAAGAHRLWAQATDDQGATGHSQIVTIMVRPVELGAFVERDLPSAYVPGQGFVVALKAEPPASGMAYAVEDQPPKGWAVSEPSDGGAFDAVNGKVKFGPYTDGAARALTYRVTPPTGASGVYEFTGIGSLDGKAYPIRGDRLISASAEFHPADMSPADHRITITELTAYAAAWKRGEAWPQGPSPIPLDYVTRAGALWQGGEVYGYDPAALEAPLCWKNPDSSIPLPLAAVSWRELPETFLPGQAATVRIHVVPAKGVASYAVEERLPVGWKVLSASDDGDVTSEAGCVRWGPFAGDEARVLSYELVPPAAVASVGAFAGKASFDGVGRWTEGTKAGNAADAETACRIGHAERTADQKVSLRLHGRPGQLTVLEVSTDLVHWKEAGLSVMGVEGAVDVTDTGAEGNQRYYRLRVPPAP